jgi:hypothetical protein
MSNDFKDSINTKALDAIHKALKDNKYLVRVGILGGKNARSGKELSNATIGAAHEFGTKNLPVRSFLRMPIQTQFSKELNKAGVFNEKDIRDIIKDSTIRKFANKIGVLAVRTVLMAFDSSGFGTWKESEMKYKKIKQTLIETHQLRDSITYDVKVRK